AVEGRLQRPLEAGTGRGPAEQGTGEDRRPLAVALQLHRARQTETAGQFAQAGGIDELCVAVAHLAPPALSSTATTPWPPAAQMLITPRPLPSSCSCLARPATMRPPVAAKGWAAASEPPFTFSF